MEAIDTILIVLLCVATLYYIYYQLSEEVREKREENIKAARERRIQREMDFVKDYALFFSEIHTCQKEDKPNDFI